MVFERIRELFLGRNVETVERVPLEEPLDSQSSIPSWLKLALAFGFGAAITYWFYKTRKAIPTKNDHKHHSKKHKKV